MAQTQTVTPAQPSKVSDGNLLRTKHLALRFKMKPTALRRVLRSMPQYADGVHTNYRWAPDSPEIAKIEKAIAARAAAAQAAKEEAGKKLAASKA